jgi:acetate kinase
MASTLIINPGSSSKKYSLFSDGRLVFSVRYERQDDLIEVCTITPTGSREKCEFVSEVVYQKALHDMLTRAVAYRALEQRKDIVAIGVRVVVPGSDFQSHQVITPAVVAKLREREAAAPLHIPPLLHEIDHVRVEFPETLLVGVSDSAFHASITAYIRRYSLPTQLITDHDITRFGYHGISVSSVVRELPRVVGNKERVIVCHIGSGMSLTAIHAHQSIETTMGYSPLSGLVMGTRAGDLDTGALLELMRAKRLSVSEAYRLLSTEGGLKGISGYADLRTLLQRASAGDEVADMALKILAYRFQKQLLGLMVPLGGVEAIIFAGTAAERSGELRARLLAGLGWFGVTLDTERNDEIAGGNGVISPGNAAITIAVIRTNEEMEMVRAVNCFVS